MYNLNKTFDSSAHTHRTRTHVTDSVCAWRVCVELKTSSNTQSAHRTKLCNFMLLTAIDGGRVCSRERTPVCSYLNSSIRARYSRRKTLHVHFLNCAVSHTHTHNGFLGYRVATIQCFFLCSLDLCFR